MARLVATSFPRSAVRVSPSPNSVTYSTHHVFISAGVFGGRGLEPPTLGDGEDDEDPNTAELLALVLEGPVDLSGVGENPKSLAGEESITSG